MAVWGAQEELLVMTHDVSYDGGVFGHTEMGREASSSPKQSVRSVSSEAGEMVTCSLQLLLLLAYDHVQKLHSGQTFTAPA